MLPEGLQFASRFDHVTGSAIREIFKVLTRPNMISFAGGSPSAEALPDRECAEIARQVLLDDGKRILQYGATEGYPPFVESLISYLKKHYGFEATPATVLPTTGSTSCMDLLCKAFWWKAPLFLATCRRFGYMKPIWFPSPATMTVYGSTHWKKPQNGITLNFSM